MQYFKSLSQIKATQDENVHFFYGNELKLSLVELHSFFLFKSVQIVKNDYFYLHIL